MVLYGGSTNKSIFFLIQSSFTKDEVFKIFHNDSKHYYKQSNTKK